MTAASPETLPSSSYIWIRPLIAKRLWLLSAEVRAGRHLRAHYRGTSVAGRKMLTSGVWDPYYLPHGPVLSVR